MSFIRAKTVRGKSYYYLVESIREGGKVRQKIIQYFGTTLPEGYVIPTKAAVVPTRSVVAKEAIKKAGTTKTMGKVERGVVPTDKSHIYYLGYSVSSATRQKRGILKNFGTTLPSDTDIIAAIGTTPIPKDTGYYLVERTQRGTRVKEKILKDYVEIATLISTTLPVSTTLAVREKTKSRGIRLPISCWALVEAEAVLRGVKVNDLVKYKLTERG